MEGTSTTSLKLIQVINSLPKELLKSSMAGANDRWVSHKVNATKQYMTLEEIDAKSKLWKKISALELGVPIITAGIPEIASFNHELWFEEWSGVMEITEAKITTYLGEGLKSAGVIFQDISSAFGNGQKSLENMLDISREISKDRISTLAHGTADHGFFLAVPEGFHTDKPIKVIVRLSSAANFFPLLMLTELEKGSSVKVVIEFKSEKANDETCFIPMTHIGKIGDDSILELVEIQKLGTSCLFFPNETIEVGEKAVLNRFILDKGSRVTRRAFSADLNHVGGTGIVTGVYFPESTQTFLYDTRQNHTASNTTSNLLFKGVLDKADYALWKGNIFVAEGVRGADGYQLSNSLLLNPTAHAESIPGLEISTDDVKCSHGVTISSVDKDQLFYLQTRGIGEIEGKRLIVDGFIRSAISRIKSVELQKYVKENLDEAEPVF